VFQEWPDDAFIDPLQGLHFFVSPAFVRCFVRGFDVHTNKVMILECRHTIPAFGGVIGVQIPRRTGDIDALPANELAYASN
jgi:hypothetical protein